MDLHQQAASLFVAGFPGHQPTPELRELIAQGIAGAILFARNVASPLQVAELCAELKRTAARPFVLSVDQEGGRVARLRNAPFTALSPMRALGDAGDERLAFEIGRLLAREVRAVGFDFDFAPVLDVDTNPANPVIGDRSFSRDPQAVARLGVALARGLEAEGVASCGKHFPGHGDTSQDSHKTLPRLPHGLKRLQEVELVPFRAYCHAGLASLMTAHVVFEAIDPGIPATFSERVLNGIVRQEWGYDGVIVSDDLEMQAIADNYPMGEAAVRSILAGTDLLLVCHRADRQQEAIDEVAREAKSSQVFRRRVEASALRVRKLLERFAAPPSQDPAGALTALEGAEHLALARAASYGAAGRERLKDPTEVV